MKNYVIMREICPICKGRRTIEDPSGFWSRLARAEAEAPGGRFDELTFYRYMWDHGFDAEDPGTWPVEAEACNVCDDNGILEIRTVWDDSMDASAAAAPKAHDSMTCDCDASDRQEFDPELCDCK